MTQAIITQCCQVLIHMFSYQDRVWCDIYDMDAAYILLGRLWLYNLDVINFDRSNIYKFKFNGKIVLKPVSPSQQWRTRRKLSQIMEDATSFSD